ncbi:hypothetical protein E2C01_040023 [Portunus trituberculatus]|uniref:Uncharacterized protein n=1 Tax=Portunus trituberculatus TaxID=210409 RepID=A0A5B7FLV4_PORTR|nr:hypothetical protein [Portunus trituberculatus]
MFAASDTNACYRVPRHDVMEYLSTHWPKPPSCQDQFGYRVFGYGVAISAPIGHDSRGHKLPTCKQQSRDTPR